MCVCVCVCVYIYRLVCVCMCACVVGASIDVLTPVYETFFLFHTCTHTCVRKKRVTTWCCLQLAYKHTLQRFRLQERDLMCVWLMGWAQVIAQNPLAVPGCPATQAWGVHCVASVPWRQIPKLGGPSLMFTVPAQCVFELARECQPLIVYCLCHCTVFVSEIDVQQSLCAIMGILECSLFLFTAVHHYSILFLSVSFHGVLGAKR